MCLSIAYKLVPGAEDEKLCEYVSEMKVDGGKVILTDIMGRELTVSGTVKMVDLVNSKIIIEA